VTSAGRRRLLGALLPIFVPMALGGCATPPTRVPMDVLRPGSLCGGGATALLVLLPGVHSRPQEFVEAGFVEAVRLRGIAADIAIADAHVGYYEDRSVIRRLRDDVIAPARRAGYQQIWLVGISLGGFGALGYAVRQPGEVDGIVALAPYLGQRSLMQELNASGGPARWSTSPHPQAEDDLEREIWTWLATRPTPVPVYLGAGASDRFADAHRLMATLLPPDRLSSLPGGHDWPVWQALWSAWLDRGLLPTNRCLATR
jgi:pimeloyl-ACP methyl ester carboxylesterase